MDGCRERSWLERAFQSVNALVGNRAPFSTENICKRNSGLESRLWWDTALHQVTTERVTAVWHQAQPRALLQDTVKWQALSLFSGMFWGLSSKAQGRRLSEHRWKARFSGGVRVAGCAGASGEWQR